MESRIVNSSNIELRMTQDELVILNNALNEVCHGFEVDEFETRIGSSREQASSLLQAIGQLLDQLSQEGPVS
jgi:transcriptional regulator of heat shock response